MNAPDRSAFIGGSDAAAILGVSPWKTAYQVWREKVGEHVPAPADEQRERVLRRGKRLEPVVLEMLTDEYPVAVKRVNQRYPLETHRFLRAEIDFEFRVTGELVDATEGVIPPELIGKMANGEIKTVHPRAAHKWGEPLTDDVPDDYLAQSMHGLMVTGRDVCLYGTLVGADELLLYVVRRDEDLISTIRECEIAFWNENVLPRVPPPPQTLEDIQTLFRKANGRPVELDEAAYELVCELAMTRQRISEGKKRKKDLQFGIASAIWRAWKDDPRLVMHVPTAEELYAMDDAELRFDGKTVATWKKQARAALDSKAMQAAHPDICAQFMKQSTYRMMRTTK